MDGISLTRFPGFCWQIRSANQFLLTISSELAVPRRKIQAQKAEHCNCLLKAYYCELPLSSKLATGIREFRREILPDELA